MEQELIELVQTLKELGPQVYATMLKQAWINGVSTLIYSLVLLCVPVGTFITFKVTKGEFKTETGDIMYILACFASLVILCIVPFLLYGGLTCLMNPDYWIITKLIP